MASRAIPLGWRPVIAAAVAVVPIIATHIWLRATGPLMVLALWAAIIAALIELRYRLSGPGRVVVRWAARLLAILGSVVLIALMVIVPLSAYLLWFDLFQTGSARGAVSFIFVMLVAYGSALYGGHVGRRPIGATAAYVCWLAFLSIPLFQAPLSVIVLASAGLVLLSTGVAPARRGSETRRATAHAVLLLGIVSFLAINFGGAAAPRGSRFVDRVLSPQFRRIVVNAVPEFPLLYNVPGYGYRMPAEDVISNPVLSNRAIFRVSPVGSRPIYLRTEVYHRFSGSGWQVSDTVRSAVPQEREVRAVEPGSPMSLRQSARNDLDGEETERTQVRILTDFYPMIPHTLDTQAVAIAGRDRLVLDTSHEAIGYTVREPLLEGDILTLHREPIATEPEEWGPTYLEIAPGTAREIRELAQQLAGETPQDSIINTLRYLRQEFEYTLEPPVPQNPSEFLTAFLFDHQRGFCVQFATAFAVISRLQGIPTRYVTGYLVQPPPIDDYMAEFIDGIGPYDSPVFEQDVIVTGYSAHAWVEVWLPETGWRVVEATPPMQPYGYENMFFDRFESVRDEGRTFQQLAELLRTSTAEEQPEAGTPFSVPAPSPWLLVVPVLAGLAFAGIHVNRPRDDASRFQSAVKRLRTRSARAGYPRPERFGWTRWAASAGREGEEVAGIILSVFFGGKEPTDQDVVSIREFTRERIDGRNGRRPDRDLEASQRRSPEFVQDSESPS